MRETVATITWLLLASTLIALLALSSSVASAQDASSQPTGAGAASQPSAEDRTAAADAFDRGTRAYLARDYGRAAQWFETAYSMAPASAALVQAVRAHERAGNRVRAATLALRLTVTYATDRGAMRQAEQSLRVASELVRVDVGCERACTIELDGSLMELASFFLEPGAEHIIRATFDTGSIEERVTGTAGEVRALRMEAPPAPPEVVAVVEPEPEPEPEPAPVPVPSSGSGISPAFGLVALGLTAVAGGVLVWSGVDALDGVPAYEAAPTPAGLADGQGRELRTNVLIGVTAGLAVTTLVLMIVADWGGGSSEETTSPEAVTLTSVAPLPVEGGLVMAAGGRF